MRSSRRIFIGFVAVGIAIVANCRSVEVQESDRALFLRVQEVVVAGYEIPAGLERFEKFNKTAFFDGSYEIEYEVEPPENANSSIYIVETVRIETKASDAKVGSAVEDTAINVALKVYGVEMHEVADFYKYGDMSGFYTLKKDGRGVGNYFTTRDGGKTFSMFAVGIIFEDPDTWREMIEPKLKAMSAYAVK